MSFFSVNRRTASLRKARFAASSLLSLVFTLVGIFLAVWGALVIRDLFHIGVSLLPLGNAEQTVDMIKKAWPNVFAFFVSFVSSVSAVLFGSAWFISGLFEIIGRKASAGQSGDLDNPIRLASDLALVGLADIHPPTKGTKSGRFSSRGIRLSAVGKIILRSIFISTIKIAVLWGLFFGLIFALKMAPKLLSSLLSAPVAFSIPSTESIHGLFVLLILFNLVTVISLLDRGSGALDCGKEEAVIRGRFAPSFYLSIFEDAFSLLNPKGTGSGNAVRMRHSHDTEAVACLVESHPSPVNTIGTRLGLLLAPVGSVSLCWGFLELMGFYWSKGSFQNVDYASKALAGDIVNIVFFIGLIWIGLYSLDRVRTLLVLARFESIVALLTLEPVSRRLDAGMEHKTGRKSDEVWDREIGSGKELLDWTKAAAVESRYRVSLIWASLISEALAHGSLRYVARIRKDVKSDKLVTTVFGLTQSICFEREDDNLSARSGESVDNGQE